MDNLPQFDLNEIESDNSDEILMLKDADEVERIKAERKAIKITSKEAIVETIEDPPDLTYMERFVNKKRSNWKRIAEEADELFDYMLGKYDNMLDGEDRIKHFDVGYGRNLYMEEADEIKETYHYEIQRELVPWIKNEFQTGDLFKMENWRPYRDYYVISTMYLGYRKLIVFKQFLLQLTLTFYCDNDVYKCDYCEKKDYGTAFSVALYGWTDMSYVESCNQEHAFISNEPCDLKIPNSHWGVRD